MKIICPNCGHTFDWSPPRDQIVHRIRDIPIEVFVRKIEDRPKELEARAFRYVTTCEECRTELNVFVREKSLINQELERLGWRMPESE